MFEPTSGTRVIDPLPAFATQAAPYPTATPTGSVPTTSVRKTRFETGFVAITRFCSPSTVQTRPAPLITCGGRGPGRRTLTTVRMVVGSSTSNECGLAGGGGPPTMTSRLSAAATTPATKIRPSTNASRFRVHRVGWRGKVSADDVFDNGDAGAARFLHHRGEPR